MAHYASLRDYAFTDNVDDIRGADLYAADGKIGSVKDVIFEHETGDIRYLVADMGHNRMVLIESNHVFRPAIDEDAFETDLTAAEAARLPPFDEHVLEREHEWTKQSEENRKFWKEREDRYEDEYKRKWEEDPVMHMKGTERIITPSDVTSEGGGRVITGADLTPHRIVDKFAQRGPMMTTSTNEAAEDLTLRPAKEQDSEQVASGNWERSQRLRTFQTSLRNRMPELRQRCEVCSSTRRVA
jgi:PRC-barrel domain